MTGHADLRSFDYALEPMRRRRSWELDAALARQANANTRLHALRSKVLELDRDCDTHARDASAAWLRHSDAAGLERNLNHLAALQSTRAALMREMDKLHEQLAQLKLQSISAQQRVEVLNRHRQQQEQEYGVAQLRKSAVEADRDWVGRRPRTETNAADGGQGDH